MWRDVAVHESNSAWIRSVASRVLAHGQKLDALKPKRRRQGEKR
jgi:hypothetical protein